MNKKQATGLLYLAPVLILIIAFFLYPSISIIKTSFYQTRYGINFNFAGLKNYLVIFGDEVFHASLVNSLIWTVTGLILQLTIPLGTALLLNQRFGGNTFARATMLVPWITPSVIIAIMARWILEPELGMLNSILLRLGIVDDPINFLGSTTAALPTLIIAQTWQFIPFGTLLILAALQTIPRALYDAMKVDGAKPMQLFRYLIVPKISPMIGFMVFLAFVWNFNVFDKIWLTTQGGPVNATMTLPVLVYKRAFKTFRMGQSSAVGTITVVGLIILGIIYFKYLWKPIKQE
ncbi:MAG: sugar ABC transporter permease [Desulfobacterales bacterium]|jgi:multiple sugar transport system permease protein|nr:MAG: sugar ABC transporter permease [Desulfobacterales bacterium]